MTSVPQIAQHPDSIRAELGDGRRRLGDEGLLPVVRRHWLLLIVITVACAVIGSLAGNSSDECTWDERGSRRCCKRGRLKCALSET